MKHSVEAQPSPFWMEYWFSIPPFHLPTPPPPTCSTFCGICSHLWCQSRLFEPVCITLWWVYMCDGKDNEKMRMMRFSIAITWYLILSFPTVEGGETQNFKAAVVCAKWDPAPTLHFVCNISHPNRRDCRSTFFSETETQVYFIISSYCELRKA